MTASILTITLNPAVDISSDTEVVRPIHKIRTTAQQHDPGGGGINVARVIATLGGEVEALYMAGGAMGAHLQQLLEGRGIQQHMIPIAGMTRVSFNVFERQTEFEYRFVPEGPAVTADELENCLDRLRAFKGAFVVASGSVPAGAPTDILAQMAEITVANGAKFILDSSGLGLHRALEGGNVYLAKPSLGELEQLTGNELDEAGAREAALDLVARGACEMVAVTLGAQGAMLARADDVIRLPARHVATKSAVGAGDSFVGAMTWALAEGWAEEKAFGLGIAAGAATALTSGTGLCRKEDVLRLFAEADL